MTSAIPHPKPLTPEQCSALFDGEAEAAELEQLCRQWADDDTREDWHTWSLIGDVLRSEDLAQTPSHDAHFLAGLRQRLAQEPTVLAPAAAALTQQRLEPAQAAPRQRRVGTRYWLGSAAVAASVAVAVGSWVRQPQGLPQAVAPGLAQVGPAPEVSAQMPMTMVRDPELDRYLAAHRQYVQGPALAAPGGVRQVAVNPSR
ncbi:sigma-E factor negative regulatory protein [Ideonella paludis]|uniref:Sigma-E factor negative regulatory protein n=1 Tax=Ideonella paludis TaxID=1233411 RepID=A0ABS5DWX2_9BURK|nr:sigma-E factor negative regulatory protein [Ideonella paludis]MBQ0935640.1 sigma-E factor negative regulatory protein [Ideonella paludis]